MLVYLLLVFALKQVGKRMLAQLNPFDFVVLLTLSNTVQNAIIGNDTSLLGGVIGAAALLGRQRGAGAVLLSRARDDADRQRRAGHLPDRRRPAQEDAMRRLHINAGELIAKAHERGFDSLDEVESAVLYPNGTIYFRGRDAASDAARHRELLGRLDALGAQLAALRR